MGGLPLFIVGLYKQEATTAVKEKALDNEISGSFSFKKRGASADLSLVRILRVQDQVQKME